MMRSVRTFLIGALLLLPRLSSAAPAPHNEKLIIAVVPEVNLVKQMERYVPLSDYLDKKTGIDVEIKPLSNYGQLYEELRDGKIDGGFFGSLVYCITHEKIGIIPLARPVQAGKSTYTGQIFVRKDAGITKPSDMKGKTIALADPATSGGYLLQKEYFKSHGIDIDKDMKIIWSGSHEAAIQAVLSNQAEIGGAKNTVIARYRKANRMFDTILEIRDDTPKKYFPDNTLAVRKGLGPAKRDLLLKVLLEMNSNPEGRKVLQKFGASKFIPTTDADFNPIYSMARHMKIDLTTYPYRKELQPSRK